MAASYYAGVVLKRKGRYYATEAEAAGRWVGRGAELLGVTGVVTVDDLERALEGRHPRSGERMARELKRPAFDLTVSAPKSVSLLWALSDHDVASIVRDAHDAAALDALRYMEANACVVRRGRGGVDHHLGGGFLAGAFRHLTSRSGDPNLHTHLLVMNTALCPDGRWSALFTPELFAHARTAGMLYQASLRHRLVDALGIRFGPVRNGYAEIDGIPEPMRRAFSTRRIEIETAMAERGSRSARGAQVAALATREAKHEATPEPVLRREWATRAAELGVDLAPVFALTPARDHEIGDDELARVLTHHDSTFDRRDVLQAVASAATQGRPVAAIEARADRFVAGDHAVELTRGLWTTPEMLAIEAEAVRLAVTSPPVASTPNAAVQAAIARRPSLADEQVDAIRWITGDRPVSVVVGHAGAGKTFALDAARDAWTTAGRDVVGCSLSARAARQLEASSGIAADTVERLLADLDTGRRTFTARSVLVVDEAGMVGTRHLARLLDHTTSAQAQLVLVGDHRQLPEIEAGGLFAHLARTLGHAELVENRRQRQPAERHAAQRLRDRDIDAALLTMRRAGRITAHDNTDTLRDRLVGDWHIETRAGHDTVMLALHRSDVDDLNDRARTRLTNTGHLGEVFVRVDDLEIAEGDHIMCLRNDRRLGLLNGTIGTATGIDTASNELIVTLDTGQRRAIPVDYIADGHLTHAYATTIHKAQGRTCDVALVLGDDTLYNEAGYTALTRGRHRNHLYIVDPDGTSISELQRSLERSRAKHAAIEHVRR